MYNPCTFLSLSIFVADHRAVLNLRQIRRYKACLLYTSLVIHGLKLMQGEQGLFVAMPSRKMRNEEFKDIVHPICPELRNDITKVVQEKYFSLDEEQEEAVV